MKAQNKALRSVVTVWRQKAEEVNTVGGSTLLRLLAGAQNQPVCPRGTSTGQKVPIVTESKQSK